MINILPIDDRKEIKKEYFRRFIAVSLVLLGATFAMAIVMLLPTVLFLSDYEQNYKDQLAYTSSKLADAGLSEIKPFVDELNRKTKILTDTNGFQSTSRVAGEILSLGGPGVAISSFSMRVDGKKELVSVSGQSATRKNLLDFLDNLKKCKALPLNGCVPFESIVSPVSNILKDKDISFSITMEISSSNPK